MAQGPSTQCCRYGNGAACEQKKKRRKSKEPLNCTSVVHLRRDSTSPCQSPPVLNERRLRQMGKACGDTPYSSLGFVNSPKAALGSRTLLRASAVVGVTGGLLLAMLDEVRGGAVSTLGASVSSPLVWGTTVGYRLHQSGPHTMHQCSAAFHTCHDHWETCYATLKIRNPGRSHGRLGSTDLKGDPARNHKTFF